MIRADFYLELLTQINKIFFAKKQPRKLFQNCFFYFVSIFVQLGCAKAMVSLHPLAVPQYYHAINPRPESLYSPGRILL